MSAPRTLPFRQVDVFGAGPFLGNPLAVVLDAEGLDEAAMRRIAAWTDLSETTFVLPPQDPGADYRVRILTPSEELPFAGHPTLGTAAAWLAAGGVPRTPGTVVQECGAGLVPVSVADDGALAFRAPAPVRSGPVADADRDAALALCGLAPGDVLEARWIDNGPGWMGLLLADDAAVRAVRPRVVPGAERLRVGLVGLTASAQGSAAPAAQGPEAGPAVEVRALIGAAGAVREDPVTGSLNAAAAQWMVGSGRLTPPYTAVQGSQTGRDGRVRITQDADGALWVGGTVTPGVVGTLAV
ncbi:PhzF family phenazine biosynthesis protein [Micrococcus sp.]|uniref:PhzF family phenazine biosynthesis protein n=1 Tax=Micrococcus sp. TaxID=1271 RepID=UPI0026DD08DD|nr:PhzF family phenazine biosynthesis protein [Micrococcus sp.]MDO4238836.1 PhzF family phenazine biosynthesis protein [Micrococcus sp.]